MDRNRPENITKLLDREIVDNSERAAKLYDTFTEETKANIDKKSFILGFLHGREKGFADIGMFDDEDDDSKIYDFIDSNPERFEK
jgi:hypothetical protein